MNAWRDRRTFGPAIIHNNDGFRAVCTWCTFRVGTSCTHVKPPRRISDPENTPEWCEMLDDTMREAREMAEFSRHA
jgi:hypothetical protein